MALTENLLYIKPVPSFPLLGGKEEILRTRFTFLVVEEKIEKKKMTTSVWLLFLSTLRGNQKIYISKTHKLTIFIKFWNSDKQSPKQSPKKIRTLIG